LTNITIPESVINIGEHAFFDCPLLVINGLKGTEAERYAKENDLIFNYISGTSAI